MAKKKKKKIKLPKDEEEIRDIVEDELRKGKRTLKKTRTQLESEGEELKGVINEELKIGKKLVRKEQKKLEEDIREHPMEYVAGAFVVGFILGKLTK